MSQSASAFLFITAVLSICISSAAQSSIPRGLDPTVQIFQVKASSVNVPKSEHLTRIQSAGEAESLMNDLQITLMKTPSLCASDKAIVVNTAEWQVIPPKSKTADSIFSLKESQWTGFSAKYKAEKCKLSQSFRTDKNPLFYGATSIYLIAINYFADSEGNGVEENQFQMGYKVSTTASVPQNEQDLGTLVAALVGFTSPAAGPGYIGTKSVEAVTEQLPHYFVLEQAIVPTSPLPYTINVAPILQPGTRNLPTAVAGQGYQLNLSGRAGRNNSILDVQNLPPGLEFDNDTKIISGTPIAAAAGNQSLNLVVSTPNGAKTLTVNLPIQPPKSGDTVTSSGNPPSKQAQGQTSTTSPSQPVDCSNVSATNPCTFTRNLPVDDKEFWDVSLGLAIPGPTENVFKRGSVKGGIPTSSPTTHTDAYAFADFYLLARWWPKQSYAPHVNAGIPITSQSLHRPYVGIAEDISPWFQKHGFPLDLCVFGGLVFMKQQLYDPKSPTRLKTDWALKPMYGVEVPISSITSKLSAKGSKSNSKGGGGGG